MKELGFKTRQSESIAYAPKHCPKISFVCIFFLEKGSQLSCDVTLKGNELYSSDPIKVIFFNLFYDMGSYLVSW